MIYRKLILSGIACCFALSTVAYAGNRRLPLIPLSDLQTVASKPMEPALTEFLSIKLDSGFFSARETFSKEYSALTPEQRKRKVLKMYQEEHDGKKPPHLSLSGAKAERLLRPYGASLGLDAVVHAHSESTALFYATWFPVEAENAKFAQELIIAPSGAIWSMRRIWNWADQGGGRMPPDAKAQSSVKQMLNALPKSDVHPPLSRLLIVTYRIESGWETRLYDRENLPKEVRVICDSTDKQGVANLPKP